MKQMSLKLNMYVRGISVINNNVEGFILNIIFWSFGTLGLLYVIFLGIMVKNIVERQSLEVSAQALSNEVRNLEVSYLSMTNAIDLNLSYSMGFKKTTTTFASRKAFGLVPAGEPTGSIKIVPNDL
ncbi:MAG TPA: hypothetical protein VK675_02875 [Candidatus Paceibacterota bacterium]|nr:hypothetical protein [Candidatus Paceibacterota bacterium]